MLPHDKYMLVYYSYRIQQTMPERWEQPRKTKKDKARRNEEIYGKYSPKHVRMSEALAEKRISEQNKYKDVKEPPNETANKK